MPNGHAEERDAVWERSRFWGTIWQIGDMCYYLGLLGSIILPLAIVAVGIRHFESWWSLMQALAPATALLVICFPVGFGVCMALKSLARRRTGVTQK